MNTLREALSDYIALRRALGFKLKEAAKTLFNFILFLEEQGASFITTQLALEWALQPSSALPSQRAKRLSWVRGFARHRRATDSRTEIPADGLLPHRPKRRRPYLYTDNEIMQLLDAAMNLSKAKTMERRTYYCLLGLLAVSGMRVSEAINLKSENVDLINGVLKVENTKFGKARLLPLHESTTSILSDYKVCREKFLNGCSTTFFFTNCKGDRLSYPTVIRKFHQLSQLAGIHCSASSQEPRLMDFRHNFAVKTLSQWYRNDKNTECLLPVLSTYLGHSRVEFTYWYMSACPELMVAAVKCVEQRWEDKT